MPAANIYSPAPNILERRFATYLARRSADTGRLPEPARSKAHSTARGSRLVRKAGLRTAQSDDPTAEGGRLARRGISRSRQTSPAFSASFSVGHKPGIIFFDHAKLGRVKVLFLNNPKVLPTGKT